MKQEIPILYFLNILQLLKIHAYHIKKSNSVIMKKGTSSTSKMREPYRHTIISADLNLRLDTFHLTPSMIKFQGPKGWGIKKWTLHGGRQEGVDLIEVNNGLMRLVVVPTRGMGILGGEIGDVRLGWDSPVKEVVNPAFINLLGRGGLGWLEGFNEWIVRCGLENAGAPGRDKFINNVGDEAEMDLTLHGKIANIPASEVEIVVEREEPYRICVVGRVFEQMFYGPKLELIAELWTEPNSNKFVIRDTVVNHGSTNQEFQLLYHINFGPPLLEENARFMTPIRELFPINARAAEDIKNFDVYPAPTPGYIERVYCITPYCDSNGKTVALLKNANGTRALAIRYNTSDLPCLTLWKSTNVLEEGYVTGIEPATGFPYNRRIERQYGRVPLLPGHQSRSFTIEYEACMDRDSVDAVIKEIGTIQSGKTITIHPTPPVIR